MSAERSPTAYAAQLRRNRERRRRQRAELFAKRGRLKPGPKPKPKEPTVTEKPPRKPKASRIPQPNKPSGAMLQANEAAWTTAQERKAPAKLTEPETVEQFVRRGGKVAVIPCAWTAPTRFPAPNFSRGKGGIG